MLATADAVQPSVSPHGRRVAYWGHEQGRRDIWTVPAANDSDGGAPLRVTHDAALDWNPVWSPDGRFLYFLSNRGGSMNLWRVAIDERTGVTRSEPQPLTTPAIDPERAVVTGPPATIVERSLRSTDVAVSPDGQWIAFSSEGEIREELYIARSDGGGVRALTDDEAMDRLPHWSPDGSRVAFYSNRNGRNEIWSIRPDGTGLERISSTQGAGVHTPVWSRDGGRIAFHQAGRTHLQDVRQPSPATELIAPMPGATSGFTTWDWTPDGSGVLGWTNSPNLKGVHAYSFASKTYERLTTTGWAPVWLRDGRRFLFLSDVGQLYVGGRVSREAHEIFGGYVIDRFSLPADNRSLYFTALSGEADVWLMKLR